MSKQVNLFKFLKRAHDESEPGPSASTSVSDSSNKETKMDWMYRDSSQVVDPEEYLLGRKVDKQFEKRSLPPDKDQEPLPASIFSLSVIENQVDIARKLQEDPLYLIKKKEIESREQLLKNPRKMKQLQEMMARQQAANEKLIRKQMKKDKKLKKSKDLDTLLAKKCKKLLGGFDMKKLVALERDSSSESSSNEPHKYKKKRKSADLDEILALKYKQILGKVDPKKLAEMSSSESDSSDDKRAENKKTKNRSSSSLDDSSSVEKNEKKVKRGYAKKQHFLHEDGRRLKGNSKINTKRDASGEVVEKNTKKPNFKSEKSRYRGSSSDSEVSFEDKKQKIYKSLKYDKNREYSKHKSVKGSHFESNKNKRSHKRKEHEEGRSRHDRNSRNNESSTASGSCESRKVHDSYNDKTTLNSSTATRKKWEDSGEWSSSSSNSTIKQTKSKRSLDKQIKNTQKERRGSNSSSDESRSRKQKPNGKSRNSKETVRKNKLTSSSSSSDSDTSFENRKVNQKKQYGLVLPANYVPKKTTKTVTEKLPSEEKVVVKPYSREGKRKLTEEEKEKKLQEMMNNAKWRDDLRDSNIKKYKKKLDAEKDNLAYSEDFMRNQMSYAMSQETVESRVKAKINTIQRSKEAMSENFARRK